MPLLAAPFQEVGEWQKGVLKRTFFSPPLPLDKALKASWTGKAPKRRMKGRYSPKQAAKKRWKKVRQKRFLSRLAGREYIRQSPFLRMLKYEKAYARSGSVEFNWFERTYEK